MVILLFFLTDICTITLALFFGIIFSYSLPFITILIFWDYFIISFIFLSIKIRYGFANVINFKLNSKFLFLTFTTLLYRPIPSIIHHTYYYYHHLSILFLPGFLLPIKVLLFAILHLHLHFYLHGGLHFCCSL